MAIKDYCEKYDNNKMLVLNYLDKQKTDSFSLVGNISINIFILSPTKYYSLVNDRVILIYNGEEKSYFPSPDDMKMIFDFLSNFNDTKDFVFCDWTNKTIYHNPFLSSGNKSVIFDPSIVDYHVSKDTLVSSKIHYGEGGYPTLRFRYNFIEVSK